MAGTTVLARLLVLLRDHESDATLPAPTGPFAVGRVTGFWRDAANPEPFATEPHTPRQLAVWIWYPAAASQAAERADYVPREWRAAFARTRRGPLNRLLTRDPARVHPHSLVGTPVSGARPGYPVVILRGGLGAQVTDYTILAEDLASHGYVVVGFDAAYRTGLVVLPDGRAVERPAAANPETLAGEAKEQLATRLLEAWTADVGAPGDQR